VEYNRRAIIEGLRAGRLTTEIGSLDVQDQPFMMLWQNIYIYALEKSNEGSSRVSEEELERTHHEDLRNSLKGFKR